MDTNVQTLIGTKEVAERLSVAQTTVWRWAKDGVLTPAQTLGKQALFDQDYIERFRRERESEQSTARNTTA
jgi:excisionase family DNA binding protein